MAAANPTTDEARTFCGLCEWICRCWSMNLAMHELLKQNLELLGHLKKGRLKQGGPEPTPVERFLEDYLFMGGSHAPLETAKLHDEARWGGNENLSIKLFVNRSLWANRWPTIEPIRDNLNTFWDRNRLFNPADRFSKWRNKFLAHNDRSTFSERPEWTIPPSEIDDYLENLGKLVFEIWKKWELEPERDQKDFDWSVNGSFRSGRRKEAEEVIDCILAGLRAMR